MIQATLYSREDCHLCRQAQEDLEALQAEYPHLLTVVDVDSSAALQRQYGLEVPVVEISPFLLKAPITRLELRQILANVQSLQPAAEPSPATETARARDSKPAYRTSSTWTRSDGFTYWLSKHYLALLNLFVGLYVGLAFLAPVLMKAGAETPANLIYRVYGGVCHQLAYRSFFLFGEQAVYPRAAAGQDELLSFNQATGIGEGNDAADISAARNFLGDQVVGYKAALCERDLAIYGSILLFGLLFAITGRRIKPLPWYLWLIFGILPIALDGFSQFFSQPPFNFIAYRESTPFFRVITGALFGFTTAWFGYPMIELSMRDTREMMEAKLRKFQAAKAAVHKPG
jgi:uncharacterized membrane protein